jgi:hypothetical protein
MLSRRLVLSALAVSVLALAGCAEKPTLRLHHAELRSASYQGVAMDIFVQVYNPNSYDIQIRTVRAQVVLQRMYALPPLAFSPNQWLNGGERTLVRVPMLIPYNLVPRLLAETVTAPVILYSVRGNADVTAVRLLGIEKDNYPINEESSVPRRDLAAAAAYSLPF